MKGKIYLLFILVGVLIIASPKSIELYRDYQQNQLLNDWEEALADIEIADDYEELSEEDYQAYQEEFIPEMEGIETGEDVENKENPEEKASEEEKKSGKIKTRTNKSKDKKIAKNFEGIIEIDKIDLKLPILRGADANNLKSAVGSIENTGSMGEFGNYALAGHRNLTRGRNFNRLDEMVRGDIIEVNNGKESFKYKVTEKLYVKPSNTGVLKSKKDSREITLVTCHPLGSSKQRLIIKGVIE